MLHLQPLHTGHRVMLHLQPVHTGHRVMLHLQPVHTGHRVMLHLQPVHTGDKGNNAALNVVSSWPHGTRRDPVGPTLAVTNSVVDLLHFRCLQGLPAGRACESAGRACECQQAAGPEGLCVSTGSRPGRPVSVNRQQAL